MATERTHPDAGTSTSGRPTTRLAIVTAYFDDTDLLPKTRLILEELLGR